MIVALVHSRGFVSDKKFYCLEFAYSDVAGRRETFIVRSPLSFAEIKALHPRMPLTVKVTKNAGHGVATYRNVLEFLRGRRDVFVGALPGRVVQFAYKGKSYQVDVLRNAGIRNSVNVENEPWNVPSIEVLQTVFFRSESSRKRTICPNHTDPAHDCAGRIVRCVLKYMIANNAERDFLFRL